MAWARLFPKITTGALILANVGTQAAVQVYVTSPKQKTDKKVSTNQSFTPSANPARRR